MIRDLRARHRRMVLVLALVVPVLYVAALAARRPVPEVDALPKELARAAAASGHLHLGAERDWEELWTDLAFETRLQAGNPPILELDPTADHERPDLLIYWAGKPSGSRSLPRGAILLGTLAEPGLKAFRLPARAGEERGAVIVYSLGYHEILSQAVLPDAVRRD